MKPSAFVYHAPRTVEEALALLAEGPEERSVLAGGQSLVPLLNLRLARPEMLVDINRVQGLDAIEAVDGRIRIGSMVRQRTLETDPMIRERLPLLAEAAGFIAHLAIRTRGTIGGSLAHADPAAELPATMAALGARMIVRSVIGEDRSLPADRFFVGPLTTAIGPGELLVAVELEPPPPEAGWAFMEVARVHGAFAIVGVAALVSVGADGRIELAMLGLCGIGGTPYSPPWLDEMLVGESSGDALFSEVGERVRDSIDPPTDLHAGSESRRHVASVLSRRALALASRRAETGAQL